MSLSSSRPTSPHIQIYRWNWGSVYSILHRATGVVLVVGLLAVTLWLVAAVAGGWWYSVMDWLTFSPLGSVLLTGLVWSTMYHLCNGVRHAFWDLGYGFSLATARRSGHAVAAISVILTALMVVWAVWGGKA